MPKARNEEITGLEKKIQGLSEELEKMLGESEDIGADDDAGGGLRRERLGKARRQAKKDDTTDPADADADAADDWSEEADAKDAKTKKRRDEMIAKGEAIEFDGKFIVKADVGDTTFNLVKAEADKVAKAKADEINKTSEVIEVDGKKITKSQVGEAAFTILKSQQAQIEKQAKDTADAIEKGFVADFEKRAATEWGDMPGTVLEKGAALRAIDSLKSEPIKKYFTTLVTAHQKMLKAAFTTNGTQGGKDGVTPDAIAKAKLDFENKAKEIEKRDSVAPDVAMRKARVEHPDLFKLYQEQQ